MVKYETKLKLGRKRDGVPTAEASDNQVSVLFRYHPATGVDRHISLSIESDDMTADDVSAVLKLLDERGVFARVDTKTWVSQPATSKERFGETTDWGDTDIAELARKTSTLLR